MKIYVKNVNKWIEVTKEEHDNYYRDINAYRRTQQNHGRCTCPHQKYYMCDMDCCNCAYSRSGDMLSFDYSVSDDEDKETAFINMFQDISANTEQIVEDKIFIENLLNKICELMPEAKLIGEMRLAGMNETQIAEKLGVPRTTMRSRLEKVKNNIFKNFSDFFVK